MPEIKRVRIYISIAAVSQFFGKISFSYLKTYISQMINITDITEYKKIARGKTAGYKKPGTYSNVKIKGVKIKAIRNTLSRKLFSARFILIYPTIFSLSKRNKKTTPEGDFFVILFKVYQPVWISSQLTLVLRQSL